MLHHTDKRQTLTCLDKLNVHCLFTDMKIMATFASMQFQSQADSAALINI
jgi:hypothetical protein